MRVRGPPYAGTVLRLVGAFLVVSILSSGAYAQTTFQVAPEEEKKPLITPPKLIRFVEANYPETEGEEPIEETVVELNIIVGQGWAGHRSERCARSAGEAFDQAALAAARQFVFEPARSDWEPLAARIRYRYVFELKAPPEEITTGWLSGTILLAEDDSAAGRVGVEILNEQRRARSETSCLGTGWTHSWSTDLVPGKYADQHLSEASSAT